MIYMKDYVLTIVLDGKTTAAKTRTILGKVEKLATAVSGKIESKKEIGTKNLAYMISGASSGNFINFNLKLAAETPKSLSGKLNLENSILRYLLVRKNL